MTVEIIYKKAVNDGVNFTLTDEGKIRLSGNKNMVNRWTPVIRENKQAIITLLARRHESIIRAWLNDIGGEDPHIILNQCRSDPDALSYFLHLANNHMRDKRHEKVLAMLEAHPDKQRAYLTTETDNGIIVLTVAIRGKAAFEMEIPQAKYDPFLLAELIDKDLIH